MMEEITSRQNSLLTKIVRLQNSKKYRREQGLFVGDGTKLLGEALRWAPEQVCAVVVQEGVDCPEFPRHVRGVRVPRSLMVQISQMEAPEGALFVAALPEQSGRSLRPGKSDSSMAFRTRAMWGRFCELRMHWTFPYF